MPQERENARREENRRRAQLRARREKVVDEEALEAVFKATGAKRASPEARRALRALAEREIARYAAQAASEAEAREQDYVDEECVAMAAASAQEERRSQ